MAQILIAKEKFSPDRKHYPTILNQGLNVHYFDFGKAHPAGVSFFNPGLIQRPDGLWLITRRSQATPGMRIGMNSLMAFRLDDNCAPMYGKVIRCVNKFDREHFEDPRAIYHNAKTYISCCNFIVYPNAVKEKWTGAHICVQVIPQSDNGWDSYQRIDPVYGHNQGTLSATTGLEKNWVWFFHKGEPHLIYRIHPHTTVKWSEDFKVMEEWSEENDIAEWSYGELRGGTPPILHDGLYWSFFHSSLQLNSKYRRRYYMGAYAFEPFPPWRIVKFTKEPILAGSDEDEWAEKKPLVVFPCGAVLKGENWIVSFGVNDLRSAFLELPHYELLTKMGDKTGSSFRTFVNKMIAPTTSAVIAYLPPPNVGHTDMFLKNLQEHPPSSAPYLLSDYPWPDTERIPDPTKLYMEKDKIACYVFLKALELAERKGLETFCYLETDCRVSGKDWDKKLFEHFHENSNNAIASGNMAIFGADNVNLIVKARLAALTHQFGKCRSNESTDNTAILLQGLPTDKSNVFVNGAPAVYSVRAVREIVGPGPTERIVARMTSSDLSIAEIHTEEHSLNSTLSRYIHNPKIMATAGETIYPFSARKSAIESGKVLAVHPIKNRWRPPTDGISSFYHCGDLGDIIYSLKAITLYVGNKQGRLILGPKCYSKFPPRTGIPKEVFALLAPLLEQQDYLESSIWKDKFVEAEWDYDMNDFRTIWNQRGPNSTIRTLAEAHCAYLGVEPLFNPDPWMVSETQRIAKIIIHRSPRYRQDGFPWKDIVRRFGKDAVFVGMPDEHADFVTQFGPVRFFKVFDFAQMAAIINGSDIFIGNQSMPCSLALALGKRVWQETWVNSPDCVFDRPTFYNGTTFPEDMK